METPGHELKDMIRKSLQGRARGLMDQHLYTRSAVLLPLLGDGHDPGNWRVLFEVRARNLKGQPGEICFPGGHLDPGDASELETALRETCEELRVERASIEVLGELGILVTPFMALLYPFVGLLRQPGRIDPNPQEVAEVFTVPLAELLAMRPEYHEIPVRSQPPEDFPFAKIPGGRNYPWRAGILPEYFYETGNHVIWGLTARILTCFLNLIRQRDLTGLRSYVRGQESADQPFATTTDSSQPSSGGR